MVETIQNELTQKNIAKRTTVIGQDGSIKEFTQVFEEDGESVMKESTIITIFKPDGGIEERVTGFDDYKITPYEPSPEGAAPKVSYTNGEYPQITNVAQALDLALQVPKELSWK